MGVTGKASVPRALPRLKLDDLFVDIVPLPRLVSLRHLEGSSLC
jgi:hypothetical protein